MLTRQSDNSQKYSEMLLSISCLLATRSLEIRTFPLDISSRGNVPQGDYVHGGNVIFVHSCSHVIVTLVLFHYNVSVECQSILHTIKGMFYTIQR